MTPRQFSDKFLTPPERKRYIRNLSRRFPADEDFCMSFLSSYLRYAFNKDRTPEGSAYWNNIAARIIAKYGDHMR